MTAPDFPAQFARTRRFTLGLPRNFTVAADGSRVLFLRSRAGDDPLTALHLFDVESGQERVVADPVQLSPADGEVPAHERARRERVRELAGGIVSFACDRAANVVTFALDGTLFVADVDAGTCERVPISGPAGDPRPSPTGTSVAYLADRSLVVADFDGVELLRVGHGDDDPDVTWGQADFIAAEELHRSRGYWWSPDGRRLAVARVDTSAVRRTHLSDPSNPEAVPVPTRYPFAGTANADVGLVLVALGENPDLVHVDWRREEFPYLARVGWQEGMPLTLYVLSRDQRRAQVLTVDADTGATEVVEEHEDDKWLELDVGVPAWTSRGELVTTGWVGDTRALLVDGRPMTPEGFHVREVVHVGAGIGEGIGAGIVFTASYDSTELHVWHADPDVDPDAGPDAELTQLTLRPGVHTATAAGDVMVLVSALPESTDVEVAVFRSRVEVGTIRSHVATPAVVPKPHFGIAGERYLRTALLLPEGATPDRPLPVLVDSYGGPGAQRVLKTGRRFLESQWFADQGMAVLVVDGRGTGGRGKQWDQAIHLDLAGPVLEDQVDALFATAAQHPQLDLSRVAVRGWSFGGFLAALAVLRRPDVFCAAMAGAPVTDWRLYDTAYTERYLGHPDEQPEAYRRSSLLDDAPNLRRPLLLVHGIADDNVLSAHTLRFSAALLEAGRQHSVLLLPGISHVLGKEITAEQLLRVELDFLRSALQL